MKTLLVFLTFIPTLLFGQVSTWRSNPPTQSQIQSTQTRVQPSIPQQNNVSSWRNNPPKNNIQPQPRQGSNIVIRDPYWYNYGQGWNNWGWNRWDMWGAPNFGWNYWSPMPYWNDWGYRQPARIYVYDNGNRDTIRGKKPIISFGIQKTTDRQIGGFFTIGNKGYFITEYNFTHDRSTFYPHGRLDLVDFPLVDDLVKLNSFYIGFGKRVKRTGVHFMVGNVNEIVRYRGKDDDGYITFPKYSNRFTTIKIGALHDYKNFTIKMDYDPIISNGTFGLGINF
jgi:hypothetical protein